MLRVLLLVALVSPAAADSRRPDSITVNAGAALPIFLTYEVPGPWLATSFAWSMTKRLKLVANADSAMLHAPGSNRWTSSVGAGGRLSGWCVPLWLQLGVGVAGFVERIGVALPARHARATITGVAFTGDLAIGFQLPARWEIVAGYDQQLLTTEPFDFTVLGRNPHDTIPFIGTFMLSLGRQLR